MVSLGYNQWGLDIKEEGPYDSASGALGVNAVVPGDRAWGLEIKEVIHGTSSPLFCHH